MDVATFSLSIDVFAPRFSSGLVTEAAANLRVSNFFVAAPETRSFDELARG